MYILQNIPLQMGAYFAHFRLFITVRIFTAYQTATHTMRLRLFSIIYLLSSVVKEARNCVTNTPNGDAEKSSIGHKLIALAPYLRKIRTMYYVSPRLNSLLFFVRFQKLSCMHTKEVGSELKFPVSGILKTNYTEDQMRPDDEMGSEAKLEPISKLS